MKTMIAAVLLVAFCMSPASARKWTDSTGKYKVEAEFVEVQDGKVRLKKENGSIIAVPIDKLSQADREYLDGLARGRGDKSAEVPAEGKESTPPKGKFDQKAFDFALSIIPENVEQVSKLTGMKPRPDAALLLMTTIAPRFPRKDVIYPGRGAFDDSVGKAAFHAALASITSENLRKTRELISSPDDPKGRAAALATLVTAAGRFVAANGVFQEQAFDAAIQNLDGTRVENVSKFFKDRMETCYVLLRASGRFVDDKGSFDKRGYNEALAAITPQTVEDIKVRMNLKVAASAVDALLCPRALRVRNGVDQVVPK